MNETTINGQAVETSEQAVAAIPAGTLYLSDGVSEPWEADAFVQSISSETGRPVGDYRTFTAAEWEAEVELATAE